MMKTIEKQIWSIIGLFVCCLMLCILFGPGIASQAANKKPDKVTNLVVTSVDRSSVELSWNSVTGAKKYEVYQSVNGGNGKKIKTLKDTSLTITGLTEGKTYIFYVRAMGKKKKKKVFGPYSDKVKYEVAEYVYLTDTTIEPYSGGVYKAYKGNTEYFMMGGNKYYHGFTMDAKSIYDYESEPNNLVFNFNGKYSKIEFDLGDVPDIYLNYRADTQELQIYCDDRLVESITRDREDLPQTVSVDLTNVYKFEVVRSRDTVFGFGEVKLYY